MKIRAAAIQIGPLPGDPRGSLEKACSWLDRAASRGVKLSVLPEWFYPDPDLLARAKAGERSDAALMAQFRKLVEPIPGPAIERIAAKAREHDMYVAFAMIEKRPDEGLSNSSALISPSGEILGVHRKTVLTPRYETPELIPGDELAVIDTPIGGIGQLICADASCPEAPRILAIKGAAIVCHPMAIFYLPDRSNRHLGVDIMERSHCSPSRSIDNNLFIVTANLTGVFGGVEFFGRSRIMGPTGETLAQGPEGVGKEELVVADLDLSQRELGHLPFRLIDRRRPEIYGAILTPNPLANRVDWQGEAEGEPGEVRKTAPLRRHGAA